MRVSAEGSQQPVEGSALAVETHAVGVGETFDCGAADADTIVLAMSTAGEAHALLALAGETLELEPSPHERTVLRATIGPDVDRHAPLGTREHRIDVARAATEDATGRRSFEILFGPQNGCTRATLFVGHVPPGAAPWHFHLYDEIVWIWSGEGRFHTRAGAEPLRAGCAFRIAPREVHVVENTSPTDELVVVGLFTPAGSPSAAYYAEESSVPYRIEGHE